MPELKTFHEQVKSGDLEGVRASLAQNPSLLDAINEAGQSSFLLAKYYRQEKTADYLLSLNPQLDIFNSCVAGRVSDVMAAIDQNPTLLEAHSSDGWTPLHLAAFFGHADLATALLVRGARIDSRSTNAMQNTPLHAAAAGGHVDLVTLLLQRGAAPNATQEGGWTALHSAAQAGNRPMVEALIANGADVNVRAGNQQAPLDLALMRGHEEIATLLEELGAKLP
ncbi:MAG: ankyrin repeat domain-containing protein [Acidobacteriaceae bacterium]|nr:ankyrin repeat domain-containing protein [Acidobacteriaceae bacterium]